MVILYLSQQTNTFSKSANETLKVTENNPNENISKRNQRWCSIKKVFLKISQNSQENAGEASILIKLPEVFIKKETLRQVLFCKFCDIFKNTFFIEHLRVTASDIRMQVIFANCNNKLYIFPSVSFHATLAHASVSPDFLHQFVHRQSYFQPRLARPLLKKNNNKA